MRATRPLVLILPAFLWAACGGEDPLSPAELQAVAAEPAAAPAPAEANPFAGIQWFRGDVQVNAKVVEEHKGDLADPIPIDFDFLGAWEFDENAASPFPAYVRAAAGRKVKIEGFMLPGVDFEHIKEFHLVRSLWGCCFGAPPRINEIVRVTIARGEGLDYTYNNVVVIGTLRAVFEMEDGVVEDLYRLEADEVIVLDEFSDPGAPTDFEPTSGFKGVLPEEIF